MMPIPLAGEQMEGKRTFRVSNTMQLDNIYQELVKKYGNAAVWEIANQLKKDLKFEIEHMTSSGTGKIREEMANSVTIQKISSNPDTPHLAVVINHKLAAALNWGTGIYNPDDPRPITPRRAKYMFIPDTKFKGGMSRFARKAQAQ